jgi:Protein of unknown function (DUF4236)
MGWRFRRSLKIAPGLRLNLSKRGAGMSIGPRGAKVSVNSRGQVRRTVSLPGTGLSHTTQSSLKGQQPTAEGMTPEEIASQFTPEAIAYLHGRLVRKLVGWGSALLILVLIFAGAPTVAGYLIIPAIIATVAAPWYSRFLLR